MPSGTNIRVERLTKRFGPVAAVDDVDFEVRAGQFSVLLGPSGSGKTTILRMIAGLETPTSGQIRFGDVDATWIPVHRRGVGYVFQRPSMFPHYTVEENVAWGLKLRRLPRDVIARRVAEMLDLVHLTGLEKRYATQLSGGQAQRVAIARALAPDPKTLLLDEPLSMLDAKLRDELKDVIAEVHRRTNKTTIMVTHDQREALSLADVVMVLHQGRLVQAAPPQELYRRPASAFVADFVGHSNFVPAIVLAQVEDGRLRVRCLDREMIVTAADRLQAGDQGFVCLRPDDLEVVGQSEHDGYANILSGEVRQVVFTGDMVRLEVQIAGQTLHAHATGRRRFEFLDHSPNTVFLGVGEPAMVRDDSTM